MEEEEKKVRKAKKTSTPKEKTKKVKEVAEEEKPKKKVVKTSSTKTIKEKKVPKTSTVKAKKEKDELKEEVKPKKKAPTQKKKTPSKPKADTKLTNVEEENVINAKVDDELIKARALRQNIEIIVLSILFLIALLLLLNKSFIKTSYKTDKVEVDLPRFLYYVTDANDQVVFKTIRKTKNVEDFFDEYLETKFIYYDCKEKGYYNEETNTFIESITVEKSFAIKTVTIKYSTKPITEICS